MLIFILYFFSEIHLLCSSAANFSHVYYEETREEKSDEIVAWTSKVEQQQSVYTEIIKCSAEISNQRVSGEQSILNFSFYT